jgi:hypothetical protein
VSLRSELRGGPVVRGLDPEAEARAEAGEAYRAVLDPLEERPGVGAIDRVWAFPPREIRGVPVALIVASAFAEGEDRRRLLTCRLVVAPDEEDGRRRAPETRVEVAQQGEVPAERVRRVLDGVVRRLGEDPPADGPADFAIGGKREAWERMREALHAEIEIVSESPELVVASPELADEPATLADAAAPSPSGTP